MTPYLIVKNGTKLLTVLYLVVTLHISFLQSDRRTVIMLKLNMLKQGFVAFPSFKKSDCSKTSEEEKYLRVAVFVRTMLSQNSSPHGPAIFRELGPKITD